MYIKSAMREGKPQHFKAGFIIMAVDNWRVSKVSETLSGVYQFEIAIL